MNKRKISYGTAIGTAVLVVGTLALCPRQGKKESFTGYPIPETENIAPKIILSHIYTVKKGDCLSNIVYNELGTRGRAIYDECLRIQKANNLGSERDISRVVNGQLVPGKDGFADLLYPGERLNLY